MFPLTRILTLAAARALVGLTAASARAEDHQPHSSHCCSS